MLDSRTPWISVGASRSDMDSTSSLSLLHSIYGSQASQLQFSDYDDSETSLQATQSEYRPPAQTAGRRPNRPNSSPATAVAAREQLRKQRPASAAAARGRSSRPGSALSRRPSSALGRPGGGAVLARTRPKTALGLHCSPPILLEDVEEEQNPPAIKDIATPVKLTCVPEYFDFWSGKPLLQKEHGVIVHERNSWEKPKSDYGSRFFTRMGDLGADGGDHMSRGAGGGGLETLVERDIDDSLLGSEGDGKSRRSSLSADRQNGDNSDEDKLQGIVGESLGQYDDGQRRRDSSTGRSDDSDGSPNDKMKRSATDSQSKQKDDGKWARKKTLWDKSDGSRQAEDDAFFKNKALASLSWMEGSGSTSSKNTRFELPMDIRDLEAMSPLQYLSRHCIISDRRMAHCSRVFTNLDKDKDLRLNQQELVVGLAEAHYNNITADQAARVLRMVEMPPDMLVNVKLFAALCCLAERVYNLFHLLMAGREVIEVVDFEALDWKLRECRISNALRMLFKKL